MPDGADLDELCVTYLWLQRNSAKDRKGKGKETSKTKAPPARSCI